MNIHLVSLFHSQDAKKYGVDKILSPFVDDVKVLEDKGMKVSFTELPLYGTIAQVTGDNLGLNSIHGNVESFTSNYYCRRCLIDKAPGCFGIKRNSIQNSLSHFSVSENFVLDIMHDILEGVYSMK